MLRRIDVFDMADSFRRLPEGVLAIRLELVSLHPFERLSALEFGALLGLPCFEGAVPLRPRGELAARLTARRDRPLMHPGGAGLLWAITQCPDHIDTADWQQAIEDGQNHAPADRGLAARAA
jgi:hypothetical protein